LVGVDRGQRFVHVLVPGENLVGSSAAAAVALPYTGVSRRHAVVEWDGSRLTVRDLGSRNGTFVNRARIENAIASSNDEIGFGPVTLRVDAVDAGDLELALRFEPASPGGGERGRGDETLVVAQAVAEPAAEVAQLHWVEEVQEALAPPRPRFHEALAIVAAQLEATGAALGEWSGTGTPRLLATAGDLGIHMEHPGLFDFFRRVLSATREGRGWRTGRLPEEPGHFCCGLAGPDAELLACVLRGPRASDELCAATSRIFLRLLDATADRVATGAPRRVGSPPGTLAIPLEFLRCVSAPMQRVYAQLERVRAASFPVLVLGETGTGKEHLVRLLHDASPRSAGPFVAVNCAAIPTDLIEAELFGVGRGVATGVQERSGRFVQAQGGTLFLDEIGELPLPLQAKLLRVLERREVSPVGAPPVRIDARIVAATNVDLEGRVAAGGFRRDLYHRIAGFVVEVPALRQRREDIGPLVELFLGRFSAEARVRVRGITVRAFQTLLDYDWPGNVRELENEIRRLAYVCVDDETIESTLLPERLRTPVPSREDESDLGLERRLSALEARLLTEALRQTAGEQKAAARLLGISRNGLAGKLKRLGLPATAAQGRE
jgi:transcriptional regulator with AAA-type ATPase domain